MGNLFCCGNTKCSKVYPARRTSHMQVILPGYIYIGFYVYKQSKSYGYRIEHFVLYKRFCCKNMKKGHFSGISRVVTPKSVAQLGFSA